MGKHSWLQSRKKAKFSPKSLIFALSAVLFAPALEGVPAEDSPNLSSQWHAPMHSQFWGEILRETERPKPSVQYDYELNTPVAFATRRQILNPACLTAAPRALQPQQPRPFPSCTLIRFCFFPPQGCLELWGGMGWVQRGTQLLHPSAGTSLRFPCPAGLGGTLCPLSSTSPGQFRFSSAPATSFFLSLPPFVRLKKINNNKKICRKQQISFIFLSSQHSSFPHLSAVLLSLPPVVPLED